MPIYHTHNEDETARLAAILARDCKGGEMILLQGPMGAGKSLFARGFIQALIGPETEVPSPTFTLVQTYDTAKGMIWHFDLYRLQDPEEIYEIGWEEAQTGRNIALVEWPERAGRFLPKKARQVTITPIGDKEREIVIDE